MIIFAFYNSWEPRLNEHTNVLIKEFYLKSTNFKIVKEKEFQKVADLINHRPRKSLDNLTHYEVFFLLHQILLHFILELAMFIIIFYFDCSMYIVEDTENLRQLKSTF